MVAGIDVGAATVDCAALEADARVRVWRVAAGELDTVARALAGARAVAIDAPAQPSSLAHAGDGALGAKFRAGRCAEVALGREHGVWVPWVAPSERPVQGWMATGLAVYDALAPLGVPLLEVYPHAIFRLLAGGALPRKTTHAGRGERAALLAGRGVAVPAGSSHHALDALAAALVARDHAAGRARRVGCGHDDSALWLPAA